VLRGVDIGATNFGARSGFTYGVDDKSGDLIEADDLVASRCDRRNTDSLRRKSRRPPRAIPILHRFAHAQRTRNSKGGSKFAIYRNAPTKELARSTSAWSNLNVQEEKACTWLLGRRDFHFGLDSCAPRPRASPSSLMASSGRDFASLRRADTGISIIRSDQGMLASESIRVGGWLSTDTGKGLVR